MPDPKALHCSVITPDELVLECDATFVTLPAHDGQVGFLRDRAPMLCKLGVGELRIEAPDGNRRYFLDGGFAQMLDNQLTILTDRADPAGDIDQAGADAELTEAIAMQAPDQASRDAKDLALARARARRRLAAKR